MDIYDLKEIWWNYFIATKHYWAHGLTYVKLQKMKNNIFLDKFIWNDLFMRHNIITFPWKEQVQNKFNFQHAIGNFSGMITEKAYKMGLIK